MFVDEALALTMQAGAPGTDQVLAAEAVYDAFEGYDAEPVGD